MPKRTDIKSILVIGAGPIIIGQACEFDYSGTQALKALREEGYKTILVNSNPATIMTDPQTADVTYIEPITPEIVTDIIKKERPDAILPTMGGQTALNCALSLQQMGVLSKYGVEMIGANADAIDKAEDRRLFRNCMAKIGLETPKSKLANASALKTADKQQYNAAIAEIATKYDTSMPEYDVAVNDFNRVYQSSAPERKRRYINQAMTEALAALDQIGLPAIIRPSFTLGGTGGGIAYNQQQYLEIVARGLDASPTTEILIEESVIGWKEYEMEVVRDKNDNCIIICSIENIDPMGVHTGDSITVAPALTLTDKEYQVMRDASIAVLREIGIETGGSNVQFAINPVDGRLIVIEMNPRVSRSSALASKATGFPIAKIAAKLAVGYTLDELQNEITGGVTPASFEPAIDYVVIKIPRFAFEKFPGAEPTLSTTMKSVGEAMAIGRSFPEALQKALNSLENDLTGFSAVTTCALTAQTEANKVKALLTEKCPDLILRIAEAMRLGYNLDFIADACNFDRWFLNQIKLIVDSEAEIIKTGLTNDFHTMKTWKNLGFSDARIGELTDNDEGTVRQKRWQLDIHPTYKRIDTCAGEFSAETVYLYSSYEPVFDTFDYNEARPSTREKVIILGGGPNRIGQGIEFDYCCCHAAIALSAAGYESIMVNCNPETVSTDYDISDRLYFEPVTIESILEIIHREQTHGNLKGVIVQLGGQTPLKIAKALRQMGVPILGTSPQAIDIAEDRYLFKDLLDDIGMKQPQNGIARSKSDVAKIVDTIGYPIIIRPSYVLGGRAMEIIHNPQQLDNYIDQQVFGGQNSDPFLIDSYLAEAIEVDVDAIADGKTVVICGIMEHIEEAGIHSGDSACCLPPHSLSAEIIDRLQRQTIKLAKALKVCGFINVQYAIKNDEIFVLEANPRASRTIPFVAKAINKPLAAIAARVMAGEPLADFKLKCTPSNSLVSVKEAVFPFSRFPGVDIILGPEMRSTGEVMASDRDFARAFIKSQIAASFNIPVQGGVLISVRDQDKAGALKIANTLHDIGFTILATGGTADFLTDNGIPAKKINKVFEGQPHIIDGIKNGEIHLLINTTEGSQSIQDSKSLRQAALLNKIPYYTTLAGAIAVTKGIKAYAENKLSIYALQQKN